MKKVTYLATMLLVMAGAVSCKKNAEVKEPEKEAQPTGVMRQVTMYAGQGAEKSSVKGGTITWSEGDKLNVVPTTGEFDAASLNIIGGVGESYGTFEGSIDSGIADDTQLYGWAGGNWAYDKATGAFTIDMPTTQTYVEDGLAENAYPSIGTGTINDGISLQNPFGVLCLNVKGESTDEVSNITVTSYTYYLAGVFTVDPSTTPVSVTDGTENSLILNCSDAVALSSDGVKFYIVIPAADYNYGDLSVVVTKSDETSFIVTLDDTYVTAGSVTTVDVEETPAPTTVTDMCGNEYSVVSIGEYMWLTENIHCSMSSNGYSIGQHISGTISAGTSCYYETTYGEYLYTWIAAVGASSQSDAESMYELSSSAQDYEIQGVCPEGFHIATRTEYDNLISNVSPNGTELKTTGWGTNETGFNAQQVGQYKNGMVETNTAHFWTATIRGYKSNQYYADYFKLTNTSCSAAGNEYIGVAAKSVRCVAPQE